jgi:uncharacterized protein YbcI
MQETAATTRGEIAAQISREAVQILRDYTGRGPTKARTVINSELVAIVFADSLTKGEAKLVDLGRGDHVLETRRQYQRAMEAELVTLVEKSVGRKVLAFLSDNHLEPDVGIEAFVLEPAEETGAGATDDTHASFGEGNGSPLGG